MDALGAKEDERGKKGSRAGMAEAVLRRLRELVEEYNFRDSRKLFQIAQRQGVAGATTKLAKKALASDVGRQIPRPPPRATGKAAATRPDSALQADLIDCSNTTYPQPQMATATPWS